MLNQLTLNPLTEIDAHCCHMGTALKHPMQDRVKPSFVCLIFYIRALCRSGLKGLGYAKFFVTCCRHQTMQKRLQFSDLKLTDVNKLLLACCLSGHTKAIDHRRRCRTADWEASTTNNDWPISTWFAVYWSWYTVHWTLSFYRAMHFSAKRGIAIACRLSVRPSVCLSVCLSVWLSVCNVGELWSHRLEFFENNFIIS